MQEELEGGRVFFTNTGRSLEDEDEIRLVSVGVDIGSSTSHLVFSRIVLERFDSRYIVSQRTVFHESEVLLTPYTPDFNIDAAALGTFLARQYRLAGLEPAAIDTGALILTGVAVRRHNARAIGELFAGQSGKFVSVSAGDGLETALAAFGSGAAARSLKTGERVMNVDIGGGTAKIAVCVGGEVVDLTAVDVGARVLCLDEAGRISRIEEAGHRFAAAAGTPLAIGDRPAPALLDAIAAGMADCLFEAIGGRPTSARTAGLLRLDPLRPAPPPDVLSFSGGVSEYIYGKETAGFGDLGPRLATAVRRRIEGWGPRVEPPVEGIRATVVGASQYTIQVSGSTIFVQPIDTLPLRNIPVIAPDLPLDGETLDPGAIADAVRRTLRRFDLPAGDAESRLPVALGYRWQGSATFARLDAVARGIMAGLGTLVADGRPVILVGDGDVGGLLGLHLLEEIRPPNPIVSIDGIILNEFDYIDIGALLDVSGAVPVVIKSLVFPTSAALGPVAIGPAAFGPAAAKRVA